MIARYSLTLALLVGTSTAFAQTESGKTNFNCEPGKKPMECYRQVAAIGQFMCEAAAMLNRAEIKAGSSRDLSRIGQCIADAEAAMKKTYPRTQASLKGKPKAQDLLKEHYAAWRSYLELMPTVDPSPELGPSGARLREKASRLAVELE